MVPGSKGMKELYSEVIEAGLCTVCGACIGLCPYSAFCNGKIHMLDYCNLPEGHCYEYCPRTLTDLDMLSKDFHGSEYTGDAIGPYLDIFMARSTDKSVLDKAQYGGVVTSLLSLLLQENIVDGAIVNKTGTDKLPAGTLAATHTELLACSGSNYIAFPLLETYNRLLKENNTRAAIVVTPCQATALGKINASNATAAVNNKLQLIIGIFCTWALAYDSFSQFLKANTDVPRIAKFDIPPPPANRFDIYMDGKIKSFPLEEIRQYRMHSCSYCIDMTAEFTDISVGAAEGTDGWNTVVVRTQRGRKIMELAEKKGLFDKMTLPDASLAHLKQASLNKKSRSLQEIVRLTGRTDNLQFLSMPDEVRKRLLDLKPISLGDQ